MDALILTIADARGRSFVSPRRLGVDLVPGEGRLLLPDSPPLDEAARASFGNAWAAARALAGRDDADARLGLAGATPLHGGSAGLSAGLLALAALLDEPLPPFFATGGVVSPRGDLEGGRAAREKAQAAAGLAPQLGLREPAFLCPPLEEGPHAPPLRVEMATDLGSAFARLAPAAYARVAARHRALRRVEGVPPGVRVVLGEGLAAPEGVPAARAPPPYPGGGVAVVEGDSLLWETWLPEGAGAAQVAMAERLARRHSALASRRDHEAALQQGLD